MPATDRTTSAARLGTPPGLIIAAPSTNSGKTTVTLALLAALRRRGRIVQPYKCGPDYIDPAFHAAAAGRPSYNLDSFAFSPGRIAALLEAAAGADLCIAEGVMGLFDGGSTTGAWGNGATADIAAATGWPVALVIDVAGQSQSAAALALGFANYRSDVRLAGVILNNVASARHEALVRAGFTTQSIPVLGTLARHASSAIKNRHLGLVQAREHASLDERLDVLATLAEQGIDLDALERAAVPSHFDTPATPRIAPPGQRIALASDDAFSFIYPHLLAGWRAAGAEIVPFSPLADEGPDDTCDAAWLPGGYPELHAGQLAAATRFKSALTRFAQTRPVHGECGGYMTLGAGLIDADGQRHAMVGLLGVETDFAQRKLHLGYRVATLQTPAAGHPAGCVLRGHEYHYARVLGVADDPLARICDAAGAPTSETGSRRGHVSGTFFHLIDVAQEPVA
ncbi:hydrogenobyrinic acid a,c-diamide synthase (glutamine-hydrolysing) / cobyrinate a,c-diamide synthase [Rhodopseudomonas palustris HaA2]|uniref:Hydrogenobyrinate a,c-diamide synthase n=1 Tax=Rhodopseudomonas palustris (strain HaA2) TaxID=316058 RepID=Q2IV79_RHOP2|nr:cobyrinate a,c-diamide synthase [Rhodopseudomonas palustris]ABD07881.1 hydrogenobyrinic acid a,c-diamide synthase (glutamine-hydrolysing) / cobyrinate a,c-diamide synthase [Rhodopseudomonas palustris HaA2]